MSKDLTNLADKTAHDPKAVLEEVLGHLRTASDAVGDKVHEALEAASQAIARAADALAEDARQKGQEFSRKATKEIKAHPATAALTATAVAAAAVALAGLMIVRRTGDQEDE